MEIEKKNIWEDENKKKELTLWLGNTLDKIGGWRIYMNIIQLYNDDIGWTLQLS